MDTKNKNITEIQMTLFETPKTELDAIWESLEKLKLSHEKVRKRLFRDVRELENQLIEVKAENQRLSFYSEVKPSIRWNA